MEHLGIYVFGVLIGFTAAVSGGFYGLGGGWYIVPALMMVGVLQPIAAAASILQMIPTTFMTVVKQFKSIGWGKESWGRNLAIPLCGALFIGGFAGAPLGILLKYLSGNEMPQKFLYFFLLSFIFYKTITGPKKGKDGKRLTDTEALAGLNRWMTALAGAICGAISGLLGIGGGTVVRPIMVGFMGIPERRVAQVGRLSVLSTAISASISYFISYAGSNEVWEIIPLAVCLAAGGAIGFRLGAKQHEKFMAARKVELATKSFAIVVLLVTIGIGCGLISSFFPSVSWFLTIGQVITIAAGALLVVYILVMGFIYGRQNKATPATKDEQCPTTP